MTDQGNGTDRPMVVDTAPSIPDAAPCFDALPALDSGGDGGPIESVHDEDGGAVTWQAPQSTECDRLLLPATAPRIDPGLPRPSGPFSQCGVIGGDTVRAAEMSPDGRRIVYLSSAGQVHLLEAETLAQRHLFASPSGPYEGVALSRDGLLLATVIPTTGEVDVWRMADNSLVLAYKAADPMTASGLAFSADGGTLATSDFLLDLATVTVKRMVTAGHRLAFASGGRVLASVQWNALYSGASSGATLTRVQDGSLIARLPSGSGLLPGDLQITPDGTRVLWYVRVPWGAAGVFEAETGKLLRVFEMPAGTSRFLGISPDGRTAIAVGTQASPRALVRFRLDDLTVVERVTLTGGVLAASRDLGRVVLNPLSTLTLASRSVGAKGCASSGAWAPGALGGWPPGSAGAGLPQHVPGSRHADRRAGVRGGRGTGSGAVARW